jgi:ABC-type uncharacterized transport system auxiliary subunit
MRRIACSLLAVLALSGCISVGGTDREDSTTSVYTLTPREAPPSSVARGAPTVAVARPEVPPGLAGERIALTFNGGNQQDFYADARWSARLEDLLADFFLRAARRGLRGVVVSGPDSPADYRLAIKVGAFGPAYPGPPDSVPTLRVSLTATLTALPAGTARGQFTVEKSARAKANTLTAVTKGLQAVLQDAADEVFAKAAARLRRRH